MTPEERRNLIQRVYYQELGRLDVDQDGLDYWSGRTDLDEGALRKQVRGAAGLSGTSVVQPLLADMDYSAWLRGMQFNESQIQSSLQAAQEAAQRRITGQRPGFDLQRQDSERDVNRGFESRGMYRSGSRLGEVADRRSRIDLSQRQFEQGVSESKAEAERNAAAQIGDLRRRNAEEQVAARDRLTMRSAGLA